MSSEADTTDLEATIFAVYRGPLEGFIARRDALAKQLRAGKRRDDADRVKALRKPSRIAWALDQAVFEDPASLERLAGAIAAAQEAPPGAGGAGRAAMENVRTAVRAVADAGARVATSSGHPIEATVLVAAVRAVIGDANAFADLRAGRLAEVPEGGGLDILTAVGVAGPPSPATAETVTESKAEEDERAAEARADLMRAEGSLSKARERAQAAERAVVHAQAKLEAAEEQLQRAQEQTDARRTELERARRDAETAAAQVTEGERAVEEVRARIE